MLKVFWHDLDFNFVDFRTQLFEMLSTQGVDVSAFTFDFESFANAITDSVICDRIVIPPCKVAGVNHDTLEIAVTSDHPNDVGKCVWMSYPFDFISRLSFENPVLQNYSSSLIEMIKSTWAIGAELGNPESAYALAMCEMLKTEGADIKKALEHCLFAAEAGYAYAQESLLCICLDALDHDIVVDEKIINKAVEYEEEWYETGNPYAGYYLGFYHLQKVNFTDAIRYFNEVLESEETSPSMKSSVAKQLAPFYKDGLRNNNGETIVYRNYHTAKKYYEMANRTGEYSADLEYINRQLGIHSNQNQMQIFAKKVLAIQPSPTGRELYSHVIEDLASEFGNCWLQLPESSRQDLVSGCQVYIMLYSLGEDLCKNIDFSSAIIPIVKACEIVFRRYISTGYYDYLIDNGVPASALPSKHPFVEYDKFSRQTVYKHKDKVEFTMGSIRWVIDLQNGPGGLKTISTHFLNYACDLFGADKRNRVMRNKIEAYFVRLANQMNQFTFNIRNPAAHSDIMPIWQAEICGNEIIKVRKVLKDFMDQLSPNSI